MEEQINPLAVTHLLQHTLRSLCLHDNSQWVYAVFWRILPRNYPPPKWDLQGGAYDRARGNRRNWILVWEDGFCNFAASAACSEPPEAAAAAAAAMDPGACSAASSYRDCEAGIKAASLQPELFFKMSHEIYNYGEGLIGKVAADHSHKWVFKEPQDPEINLLSAWNNPADSHPRTWEAQFQSGIKTIALIAVREGVVQLGAVNKVVEDLSYVVLLRKKFGYLESIPGVLLPHPSAAAAVPIGPHDVMLWPSPHPAAAPPPLLPTPPMPVEFYDHFSQQQQPHPPRSITPSMSSLEALLSKLPSVGPAHGPNVGYYEMPVLEAAAQRMTPSTSAEGMERVAKEEEVEEEEEFGSSGNRGMDHYLAGTGESSSSMASYYGNVGKSHRQEGF